MIPLNQDDCNQIIDKRLNFSLYHKIIIAIIFLIIIADGSEALSLSVTLPCVIQEFNLDAGQENLISTIYYVGVMLGALFGGIIADNYGRKNILIYTYLLTGLLGFKSLLIYNFIFFIFVRFLFGFFIGVISPLSVTIITESLSTEQSGRIFMLCRVGKSIGELFTSIMAAAFLDKDLNHGNWRALLLIPVMPALICFALSLKYSIEPPRYFIAKKNVEEAEECFKNISERNKTNYIPFNEPQKSVILDFYEKQTQQPFRKLRQYLTRS